MLYNNFIVCMMVCSLMSLLCMLDSGDYKYIILPIGILIWGIFKFFDDDDREYLRRNGINPDEFNAFFPDYYDTNYYNHSHHSTHSSSSNGYTKNENTITWDSPSDVRRESPSTYGGFSSGSDSYYSRRRYQNPTYKSIVSKCKRNFKITVDKEEKDESRKRIIHRIASVE